MAYVRFIPGFSRHPKRIRTSPIACWLWVCSVDYCLAHLTDGFIDEAAIPTLVSNVTPRALQMAIHQLLAVGSWERVPQGFIVHDYLRHNASKADVEKERQASRERYYRWRDKRDPNAVSEPVTTPQSNALATPQQQDYLSVRLSGVKTHYSEEPVTHVTSSNGEPSQEPTPEELDRHAAKQRAALEILHRAGLKPPPHVLSNPPDPDYRKPQ